MPTASLRLLYGFFVIEHGRRHIVHFNATFQTSAWVIQQPREAFPYTPLRNISSSIATSSLALRSSSSSKQRAQNPFALFCSPWQNGTAERWVGSCRRELLEHVVVLGACHLIRLVRAYISYYHEDRCHLGLNKDTPSLRAVTHRPSPTAKVVALPRVGGLHHRYEWREAA